MSRKAISKGKRFEIFKRDNWTCRYCGAQPPGVVLHVDHVVPLAGGGTDEEENLVTSCQPCNIGKGAKGLGDRMPPIDPDAPEELLEKAEQLRGYQESLEEWLAVKAQYQEFVGEVIYVALWGESDTKTLADREAQRVVYFVSKLGLPKVLELAEYTGSKRLSEFHKSWKYFYACCRNTIEQAEAELD